jgi:autotransporter translocation and assembly factor TamB
MKKIFTWIRWTLLICALLLVAGSAAILMYTQTDGFRRMVEVKAVTAINQSITGVVSWNRVEGSLLGNLRIYGLRLSYQNRDIFRAARADLGYSLLPLLWGRVRITQLRAAQPWLELRKDAGGDWTLVEALSAREPSTEPSQWVVAIDSISIEDGELILEPAASKPEGYRMRRLNLNGGVRIASGLLDAKVPRLSAWIEAQGAPQVYAQGGLIYHQTAEAESLTFEKFWLQTTQSRVMLAGTVKDFATLNADLKITLSELAAADLARFVPRWPAGINVRGAASARGPGKALDTTFSLVLAGAELSGALRADVLGDSKPFSGNVMINNLNVAKVLPDKRFAGVLDADVKISGAAANLESVKGTGKALLRSVVVNQVNVGEIALQGTFSPKVTDLTGELRGPVGQASWRSHLMLAAQPEYSVAMAVRSLDAVKLLKLNKSAPGALSFTGTVEGKGFDPQTMNTRANLDLMESQLGEVAVEKGKILGSISQGRIRFQQVQLQATGATLTAQGELGIDLQQPGRLDYRLQMTDLKPWLDLIERQGSGRLEMTGSASGNLAQLQTQGTMTLQAIDLPELAVQSGRVDFNLKRKSGATLPEGNINLDLAGVRAGAPLAQVKAAVKLPPPGAETIAVTASARDHDGRVHRLVADVVHQTPALRVRARELTLSLPDGSWRLAEPATVTRLEDDYLIDRMILRNQAQVLSVAGRFSLSGAQALDASIEQLSLATLYSYYTKAPDITGKLSARAQIRGTAAAPAIEATAELTDSKIAGQNYQGMRAVARYQNRNLTLDATIEQDKAHSLQVRGTIPLALSWDSAWRAQALEGMDLRARSAGLSLAFLNAFKPAAVQNINGEVAFDIALRGTLSVPEPRGSFQLRDGTFDVKALGTKMTGVFAEGSADAQRITIGRLSARAGSGTLEGSGVIALRQFAPESISLAVTARRWPAVQTDQYRAIINGNVRVAGPPSALRVGGAVEVIEGNIRPALDFLEHGTVSLKRDPTIVVVQRRGGNPLPVETNGRSAAEENELLRNLVLEMTVTIPNNLWIRHPNANVELTGKLTVMKKPQGDLTVSGPLETVRGWVGFQGRRFTLTQGKIQFTGGKPTDAILDVAAEYRVNSYLVNAVVKGTAEKPTLVLQSQPVLEQSDILSLLLFGRPVADLTNSEQVSLQQNAIGLTAGLATAALGKTVSDALGLQALGIDLSDVSFTGGQVRFGQYVGSRTYFSVSQDLSGKEGQEVSIEYQITPEWRVGATTSSDGSSGFDIIWRKRY